MSAETKHGGTLLKPVTRSNSNELRVAERSIAAPSSEADVDPGFRVRKRIDGSVDVSGEVDFRIGESFRSALSGAIPSSGTVLISLRGLEFIDSNGIRAIVSTARSFPTVEFRLISARASFVRYWTLLTRHSVVSNVKLGVDPTIEAEEPGMSASM